MDSRHETKLQEIFNELITLINNYIQFQPDTILAKPQLQADMKEIIYYIYQYVHMPIDVEHTLSTMNLLSTDTVSFPQITDLIVQREVVSGEDYHYLLDNFKKILKKSSLNKEHACDFYERMREILD